MLEQLLLLRTHLLRIVEVCLRQIRRDTGINLASQDKSGLDEKLYQQVMRKLQFECEKAKVELSAMEETEIIIHEIKYLSP